jgi:hypothetical protein
MLKKIVLGICFISFFSYAAEQPVIGVGVVVVSPDISPKAFGVNSVEPYIRALRDFAHALLMQHRWLKTTLDTTVEMGERLNKKDSVDVAIVKNALACIAWLEEAPEFKTDQTLQEMKQAIESHQDHKLIFWTGGGLPVFAMTPKGVEVLLQHRSLFLQDTVDLSQGPLIDKIYQQAMHQENMELKFLAEMLKFKLEQAQMNADYLMQAEQRRVACGQAVESRGLIEQRYKLSPELYKFLLLTEALIHRFIILIGSPAASIPDNPIRMKQGALAIYNQTQPILYATVRERLRELTASRRLISYRRTIEGEYLPEKLESLDSNPLEEHQSVPIHIDPVPSAKHKTYKEHKQKPRHKKKSKQHKALPAVEDDSEQAKELDELPDQTLEDASAQPIEAFVVQEEQPRVAPDASPCIEQNPEQVESPVAIAPAPNISKPPKCQKARAVAPVIVQAVIVNPIDIPYSDGKVLKASDDDTVIIDDPCNKMRIFLFQTPCCDHINYKPCYKPNVKIWFKSAKEALREQDYLDPLSEKFAPTTGEQFKVVCKHRFSKLVDRFIPKMGVKAHITSKMPGRGAEPAIAIPGRVEFCDSKSERSCYFVYYIDQRTRECFHRNLQFKLPPEMYAELQKKGFFEVEQPPIDIQKH